MATEGWRMPSTVIEVVLGLIFIYFIFSMLCSGINEFISRVVGKRADFLTAGLWSLLDNSPNSKTSQGGSQGDKDRAKKYFEAFLEHPLVRQLGQAVGQVDEATGLRKKWHELCGWIRRRFTGKPLKEAMAPIPVEPRDYEQGRLRPSYIPPRIFATVVASFLRDPGSNDLPKVPGLTPPPTDGKKEATTDPANDSPLFHSLQALADETTGDPERLRVSLESWYDAQMERVSGWYKRESKRILLVLATAVVVAMNVDTIAITRTLWTDPTARTTLADAAAAAAATTSTLAPTATEPPGSTPSAGASPPLILSCPESGTGSASTTTTPTTPTATPVGGDAVTNALDCARSLPIPIGWRIPRTTTCTICGQVSRTLCQVECFSSSWVGHSRSGR